ncbi:hypothetical protein ACTU3I_16665 [Microbacterium sp. RD1]|uniref:hypothetical protein n=1 Tax=Microbacterium sp. RD1 TaxID=3457313 RepID=UPI003FA558EF
MPRPRALPPALSGRAFTVAEADAHGIPRGRLRAKDLATPFRGVRMPAADATDLLARCRAYVAGAPTQQLLSHVTAARLWGIPLPRRLEADHRLHVLYRDAARAPRGDGVVGHKTGRAVAISICDGVRLTDPVTTWLALAPLLTLDELIVAGDRLVGWRSELTTLAELAAAVTSHSGMRGAKRARAALAEIRPGSRSPRESRCRLALVRAGLPEPALNTPVVVGDRVIHGDLSYPGLRILFEYDSDHHRVDDRQWAIDLVRYNALSEEAWIVVRIPKHMTDAEVVEAARRALRRRGLSV